ncbi:MAG: hypothetical protein AAFR13_00935 [Pseudomonadota bacterium]
MPYRTLDRSRITKTAEMLERRIAERFPQSSLRNVAREVAQATVELGSHAEAMAKPIWWLRAAVFLIVFGLIYLFSQIGTFIQIDTISSDDPTDLVQAVESAINTAVFAGIGIYTLANLEKRMKRSRALKSLHAMRSIIHIIDMHQLTKDPSAFSGGYHRTENSPERTLTPNQLARYLDYCSELLSITGKTAALYAQSLDDDVVVGAVNDIESLGTNLSRKIWQKIMLIDPQGAPAAA